MTHFLTGEEKYRDLIYDDDDRSYLVSRTDAPSGYRFGRAQAGRLVVRTRGALSRVNGYLKNMIEAAASAKLRRMQRELELHGIAFDRPHNNCVARRSDRTERSRETT